MYTGRFDIYSNRTAKVMALATQLEIVAVLISSKNVKLYYKGKQDLRNTATKTDIIRSSTTVAILTVERSKIC